MDSTTFESQIQSFRKKVDAAAASRKKQILALRTKAADAALHWVMAHRSRVNQFKSAVQGTPFAHTFDKLLQLLETEAKPAKKSASKKAAAKGSGARKSASKVAKKAPAKKAARKAAKKTVPPPPA
ncbi:MAG: hypothetical protein AB1651_05100 [Pseudomonadota bacterium]